MKNKYDPTPSLAFGLAQVLETTVDDLFAADSNESRKFIPHSLCTASMLRYKKAATHSLPF